MSQGRFEEVKTIMRTCAKTNGKEFPEHLLPALEVSSVFFVLWLTLNYNFITEKTDATPQLCSEPTNDATTTK